MATANQPSPFGLSGDHIAGAKDGTVVCLLVVNRIPHFPKAAVTSILKCSTARIVVGYVSKSDIEDIPSDERVDFLDLSDHLIDSRRTYTHGEYREYGSDAFTNITALKWSLVEHCLTLGEPEAVIYSDVDVIWLDDAAYDVTASLRARHSVQLLVQSQDVSAAVWLPCGGFVAYRGSKRALEIVRQCNQRHHEALLHLPPEGSVDDETVLRDYYPHSTPGEIQSLPQAAYPVGSLANLYRREAFLPGLDAPRPIIFHANFVIGIDAKIDLLTRVLRERGRFDAYLGLTED